MRYGLIKDSKLFNKIEATADFIEKIRSEYEDVLDLDALPKDPDIGAAYDPVTKAVALPPDPPGPTPEDIAKEAEKQAATDALKQLKIDSKDKDLSSKEMSDAIKLIIEVLGL